MSDGCPCQGCGERYKVDVLVPDELWEKIKPLGAGDGAGLLCGGCIARRIERLIGFAAFQLVPLTNRPPACADGRPVRDCLESEVAS